jgi:hypothetical protein
MLFAFGCEFGTTHEPISSNGIVGRRGGRSCSGDEGRSTAAIGRNQTA